ncbi:MAG: hypothetical protein OEX18_01135 [Candidatus Krumholzibacteria bacterium]|nr:hypothetical protein [Candidatus Krumholzibacteria bacterium]MDH4335869.1 hypothetical protein [Candidatus Krumholzibacteria bacterium]MDH5270361.1 hypothetical protein [Candidatus Krumholzibacteria bacterium]MDH5626722.1 hypothetical protein [Candidatus Krumholzibacteria bacterium]
MKRLALFFVLVAATATVVAPAAQAIGVYAAYWNPKDSSKDGFGAGLKFDSSFTPIISMDTRVSYINFSDSDFNITPIEATAKVKLGTLYAGLGLGYYFFSGDADIKDDWGWYALAGLNVLPGPIGVFGEFKWQFLEPDNGGNLESYCFHVGVTLGR